MNRKDKESIIIKEKLLARASAEYYRKRLSESDFARGAYSTAEIACLGKGSVLCVFLNDNGSFGEEIMLNRDLGRTHKKICERLLIYAEKHSYKKVFLGRHETDLGNTEYLVAGGIIIRDTLIKHGIELMGYYLTNGFSAENILPERSKA